MVIEAVYCWVIKCAGEGQGVVSGVSSRHGVSEFWSRCERDKGG
jgi:hypothetical protein